MSLPKKYCLAHQREFDLIKKEGKLYSWRGLGVLVLPDEEKPGFSRFGFLISRKVDRRAVYRNRLKRILSESLRPLLFRIKADFKVVFLPRPSLKKESFLTVKNILEELLFQAGLLDDAKKNSPPAD